MIKLIHISDLHLGKPFKAFYDKGEVLRQALIDVFNRIVDFAIQEDVKGVLIAGDLFDSNSVGKTINIIQGIIKKSGLNFYILPGAGQGGVAGHDALVQGSLYLRESWQMVPNAHIFKATDGEVFYDSDYKIAFYGKPTITYNQSPLPILDKHREALYHIALVHGSIQLHEHIDDYPFTLEEVAALDYQYVALGHWHRFNKYEYGGGMACYCGVAEILEKGGEGRGTFALICLKEGKVLSVECKPIGRFFNMKIPINVEQDLADLSHFIQENVYEPQNTILNIYLSGDIEINQYEYFKEALLDKLKEVFHVFLDDKDVRFNSKAVSYPANTVAGQFIRLMEEKLSLEPDEDKRQHMFRAMQIGIGLLAGEKDKKDLSLKEYLF
ncbi:MAG: DNA repair exonuclease [Candidatus Magnetoovum sp. WYHC-5]|nr:DNA repair exonuclease [Candidatus Magnetoovum sp. WYHC-5]